MPLCNTCCSLKTRSVYMLTNKINFGDITVIKELASQLSTAAGIKLSSVELEDGRSLDCIDVHLLSMKAKGMVVHTTICNADVSVKSVVKISALTKKKIGKAIERLKV